MALPTIELYVDPLGEHRWTKRAANGEITGASTQGYVHRADALTNLQDEQGGSFLPDHLREENDEPTAEHQKYRIGVFQRRGLSDSLVEWTVYELHAVDEDEDPGEPEVLNGPGPSSEYPGQFADPAEETDG